MMTQTEINDAIHAAFLKLSELNKQVYEYWINELYEVTELYGLMIKERWNEETLQKMEDDVMQNSQLS
jgi:hypothetical protein